MSLAERVMRRVMPLPEVLEPSARERVRTVLPLPPHDPEPFADEPFAPVYSFEPLRGIEGMLPDSFAPREPDDRVFGPPGSGGLQRQWNYTAPL